MTSCPNTEILSVAQLSLRLSDIDILQDIHFSANIGDMIAVVGPNGAGKSSLVKSLARVAPAHMQHTQLHKQSFARYSAKAFAQQVAFVPQHHDPELPFTVREWLEMAMYPYLGQPELLAQLPTIRDVLSLTQTLAFEHHPLRYLSGGERQRVFIAAALMQKPQLLLLDEPTSFLDPAHAAEVLKLLKVINQTWQTTILCVTHDLNIAQLFFDKTLALKSGKIYFFGETQQFMQPDLVNTLYDYAFCWSTHPQSGAAIVLPQVSGSV